MTDMSAAGGDQPDTEGTAAGPARNGSQRQQIYRGEYDRLRGEVAGLTRAVAQQPPDSPRYTAALEKLCAAADTLCSQAEAMPARMDEEAQAASRRTVRLAGAVTALVVVAVAALILSGVVGWGWWLGAVVLAVAAGLLLFGPVAPPGSRVHRAQRRPAVISPVLAAAGGSVAGLTSWWWAALLLMIASLAAAGIAQPDTGGSAPSERTGRR